MTTAQWPRCPECNALAVKREYPHVVVWLPSCKCGKNPMTKTIPTIMPIKVKEKAK